MLVYHGSYLEIQNPDIEFGRYNLDFGKVFYVTTFKEQSEKSNPYDGTYGNRANDDVATIVNDYIRLLQMRRISEDGKRFYLEQLQYSEPNNQYCIATQKGIEMLKFKESYSLGD